MKKTHLILKFLGSLLCSLLLPILALCQTETFDIIQYIAPKNFKKDAKQEAVIFSEINEKTGKFCVVALNASTASSGSAENDFKNKWKELVLARYQADENPKTESAATPDGWKTLTGAAIVKQDSIEFYVLLTVFSGFGKVVTVLANLNDDAYFSTLDALLENMKPDKAGIISKSTKDNNNSPKKINTVNTGSKIENGSENNPSPVNAATAPAQKFGSVLYNAPGGWKVAKYSNAEILSPSDLPQKEILEIRVLQPLNFSGTLDQALQKSYDEVIVMLPATKMREAGGGDYTAELAKKSFKGWEYIRCSGGIRAGGGDFPPEYGLELFVIKMNNRFERIAVIKSRNNCNLSRYYSSDRQNYRNDIERFLFSLQFADWKEIAVKPGIAKGDGLIGVWEGVTMSVGTPTRGAMLGIQLKGTDAIFFSNGQAYFGTKFPVEGLDGLDTRIAAELNRRDWGTYTFSNGIGVLKLPYGDIPLKMEKDKLVVTKMKTDHRFIKMPPVDGARFNGTYVLSSKNILGEEMGKTPTINLTTDGKFTDDGAISVLYHEYITCLNPAITPGSGTYEVKNHTVLFNYADGRRIKIAFVGIDYDKNNSSPSTLTLSHNWDVLSRR